LELHRSLIRIALRWAVLVVRQHRWVELQEVLKPRYSTTCQ